MRPKLRGPDYYPGETYFPLNMSAFIGHTGSSKLNAAESSMQEALSLEGSALHGVVFARYERPGNERESSTAKIRA